MSNSADLEDKTLASEASKDANREDLTEGARVGRYVIQALLGEGGMGLVYTAHDPQLDRPVAVKILRTTRSKTGETGDSFGQMRLMREAQAMAQLSHPNVMPVFDVGAFGKSVFVAMELVRGMTLDRWVKVKPRTWREIVEIFVQAGRGLVAAHAAGLVHRDFKPANVLIGEDDGRPRVTDFGIARSTRSGEERAPQTPSPDSFSSLNTPMTQEGAMMGSPGYMAPEQYAGAATSPATDQFSFCVSLYEALYGRRPFLGKSIPELAHATSLGQVPPPPKGSTVPLWVHRILEKGLHRLPESRHPSMSELLDALSKDPAQARRRNLTIAGITVVVIGAVLSAVWVTNSRAIACSGADTRLKGVWDPELKAKAEKAFLATGKTYAQISWEHAAQQMDAYARTWVLARAEACEASRVRGEQTATQLQLRYACLDRRLDELQALGGAFTEADVEVVDQASVAVIRLSSIADCAQVRSLEDRKKPPAEDEAAVAQVQLQLAQGRALFATGKFDLARTKVVTATELAHKLKFPEQEAEAELARGELERTAHKFEKAGTALQLAARYAFAAGDDALAARALSLMVSVVGWRLERPKEGRALGEMARGLLDRIGGNAELEAMLLEGIGDSEWQAGDRTLSLENYHRALDLRVSVDGPQSPDVARLHSAIGWVLTEMGNITEAREELLKSKAIREKVFGADHPILAEMWNELGQLAGTQGDLTEAARCYERSAAIDAAGMGKDSLPAVRQELNLAEALALDGQGVRAEPLVRHAEAVLDAASENRATYRTQEFRVRALVQAAEGHWAEATRLAREGLTLAEGANGFDHPEAITVALELAHDLDKLDRHTEALELLDRIVTALARKGGDRDNDIASALIESAHVLQELNRPREALERLERAVGLLPLEKGDSRHAAMARFALAEALWANGGDHGRARQLAVEAKQSFAKASRASDAQHVVDWLKTHVH